ncbi:MAG: PmoA family protein [Opitutaceae bacterium]|nr:PmoA family protein [Opitutaceae bacterium]
MSPALTLRHEANRHVEVAAGDAVLMRYVYAPDTRVDESPRPYAHPVRSLAGDTLTNFRPNDHPWHHGLSMALTSVAGINFWGGPSHRSADGYQPRGDHGAQLHRGWLTLTPEKMEERLDWCDPRSARILLHEHRELSISLIPGGWALRWTSELRNATGGDLALDNYHSLGGLAGSHYTGLQFRGARDLLDQHGDATISMVAEGGLAGEAAVHGALAHWMEWSCQHDGSLRRTRIRFENLTGPLPWFVRAKNPLAAFAFHREKSHPLPAGGTLRLDHLLSFTTP